MRPICDVWAYSDSGERRLVIGAVYDAYLHDSGTWIVYTLPGVGDMPKEGRGYIRLDDDIVQIEVELQAHG